MRAEAIRVRLYDTPVESLPEDLYIPPSAFAVWLEQFEGPLDFLLYLVKKNNFDIESIALLPIIEQYLVYIRELDESRFELAGDYLLMASALIAIKSELLLPDPPSAMDDETPSLRKKLMRRLEEYAQIKAAAARVDTLLRLERDVFVAMASLPDPKALQEQAPPLDAHALWLAFLRLQNKPEKPTHHIDADVVPLAERMASIARLLSDCKQRSFFEVLDKSQGKLGVVVSFVATLELAKRRRLRFLIDEKNPSGSLRLVWNA